MTAKSSRLVCQPCKDNPVRAPKRKPLKKGDPGWVPSDWHKRRFEAHKQELDKELDKCQILCRLCHIEKTKEDIKLIRPMTHGSRFGWQYNKCSCELCLDAKQAFYIERRQKLGVKPRGPINTPMVHGSYRGYNRDCRCDLCRQAYNLYMRNFKHGIKTPTTIKIV